MGRARAAGAALAALAMLAACAPPNIPPHGCGLEGTMAPEGPVSEVLFVCYLDPYGRYNGDILVMRPGERARLLTDGVGVNLEPRWSPDGRRIAFMSTRSGTEQIYVLNADGTGRVQVTHTVSYKGGADWSPDGTELVYSSMEAGMTGSLGSGRLPADLYVSRADGSSVRRLTTSGTGYNSDPSWSPDGRTIAFYSDRGGPGEIWLMDPDGGNLRRLTEGPALNARPSWSPGGTQIAFHSERDYTDDRSGIYVMNADGSDQHMVTRSGGWPDWSADGQWIVFSDNRDGNFELYVIHPDGTGLTRLTNDFTTEWLPRWRPV